MKENEKPEGLAKGKFVTLTGTCKYCGNQRFVRADPDEPQEKIDEYASAECDCPEAYQAATAKDKYHLLLSAGSAFDCPGWLRIAYCVPHDRIARSRDRFVALGHDYGLN